jgi:hypothetical protein
MKLIFLDIDGVMNNQTEAKKSKFHESLEFAPSCVRNLKRIISETDAKIVISSSWRRGETVESMKERIFVYYGLDEYVIGITPHYHETIRGLEIADYLAHKYNEVIEGFVILDDDIDMGSLMKHHVKTNHIYGLTEADADKAIYTLNK